jgi:hypothetical protein
VWTDFAFAETIHLFREKADRRVAVRAFHRGHAPCGLTLELSGGEAVRLERVVRPHATTDGGLCACSEADGTKPSHAAKSLEVWRA